MRERMSSQTKALAVSIAALIGIILLVFSIQGGGSLGPGVASAAGGGPEMALTVRNGGFCGGSDCYAAVGESFQLSVDVVTAPAEAYIMFQTYIDFGGVFDWGGEEDGAGPGTCIDGLDNGTPLDGKDYFDSDCTAVDITYIPANLDEEFTWPDVNEFSLTLRWPYVHSSAIHGAVSRSTLPVESTFTGEVLSLRMSCPATPAQATIKLIPYGNIFIGTQGTVFADIDGVKIIPKVNSITMNCIGKSGGDTDGDGCSDAAENGLDPAEGGDRDWLNPWDFYDVAGPGGSEEPDGVIDLPNDYMAVAAHFSPSGDPPYDVKYDRGAWGTGGSWDDTQGPDGVIDLPNDLLGVMQQIGHSCA